MDKPKYLITNCVYGPMYSQIFLEQHLKSCLDETNLPDLAERYDIEYLILTDHDTTPILQQHPNMKKLSETVKQVSVYQFDWGNVQDRFGRRYSALQDLLAISVKKAIKDDALLTCWVADLVVAKEFFSKITSKMEEGHGAVFVLPARSAAEAIIEKLEQWETALPAMKLWKYCHENLHPLWWSCHWDNPLFSKLPFCLIWNNANGLRVHSYSLTPIIFKPTEAMAECRMIDSDVPGLCENPYWATDWTDAPVIGVEPLFCYYPTFENRRSSIEGMKDWQKNLHPTQVPFLERALYYPNKEAVGEIEVKDIPGQILMGYSQEVRQHTVNVPIGGSNPSSPAINAPLNRAQRRAMQRLEGRK